MTPTQGEPPRREAVGVDDPLTGHVGTVERS